MSSGYMTLQEVLGAKARSLLARANRYRGMGREDYARNCERKALKKLEHSFQLTHLAFRR